MDWDSDATTSMNQRRQCWECARRRLVCDSTRPSCTKCSKSGVECPGYGKKKPLKWLEPGQVNSQRGRRRTTAEAKAPKYGEIEIEEALHSEGAGYEVSLARVRNACSAEIDLIPRFDLIEETADIVHSINYYNERVFPEYQAMGDMIVNPFIVHFPLKVLHYLPPAVNHTMAFFGYGHRIYRREIQSDHASQMKAWARIYHHRGLVIQELKELITRDPTGSNDITIVAINQLLVTEILVLQSSSRMWRDHAAWLVKLIQFRGGYLKLFRSSRVLPSTLALFMVVLVFANATSPSTAQLSITSPTLFVSQIKETYDQIFPYIICPEPLFIDIITISNIRGQAPSPGSVDDTSRHAADEVLSRIIEFSPAQWALQKPSHRKEWELVAALYQSSCVLYCISSLQDHAILACTPDLQSTRKVYGDRLFALLEKGLKSFYIAKFMGWPLLVAGVEAVHRSKGVQRKVAHAMETCSVKNGISTPLIARSMLVRFWASGRTGWDDCFDRPYALIV